ncbi:MAG: hypothetical protein LIP77_00175, partial [Planctomycetes bacterium]|nr:hypothetical protein [Planctomycetota bacterium]
TTIGFGAGLGDARVMEIINVAGDVSLENLKITGGAVSEFGTTSYHGGGGLYIGATGPNSGYANLGVFAASVTLTNMTISDNSITITGSTDVYAFGGVAFIDATKY